MQKNYRIIVFTLLFFLPFSILSQFTPEQKQQIDSLNIVINNPSSHDTSIVGSYIVLSEILYISNLDTLKYLSNKAITIAEKSLQKTSNKNEIRSLNRYSALAFNNIGIVHYNYGEIEKCIEYYNKAVKIQQEIDDKSGIATSYNNIGMVYYYQGEFEKAIENYRKSLKIQKEISDKPGIALSLNNIGYAYKNRGEIEKALEYLHKALKIYVEINNDLGVANSYNNIGLIFYNQGQIEKCIEYYNKSLKIYEKIGNKSGVAISLNNIGLVYKDQGENEKSLTYHFKSLKIQKEIGSKTGIANSLNGIGYLYMIQGEMGKSLDYFNEALKIREEIGDKNGMGMTLNNLAFLYQKQGQNEKSLEFNLKALKVREEIGDKSGMSNSYNNIGAHYFNLGKFEIAKVYLSKGLILALELGFPDRIKEVSSHLYKIAENEGNWFEAFDKFRLYITMRDSINNEETYKATIQQNAKYEYEKKSTADSIVSAEAAKINEANLLAEKAENKRQQQQKYYLFGGLFLALIFGVIVFNRFRTTRKQKGIIERQKETVDKAFEELEEKNTEILDSINYAKRIQSAILPPNKLVKEYLTSSFIHYKPKDIVAGDFYWMEPLKDGVLFAAADCTGHGVPGAMVSVVCNNGLNRSVREYGLTDPGEILNKTREIVIQEFEKSEDEVKDGMDIALCKLKGNTLEYAGAHNPLWIIRKGAAEVEEIKANKQPIGKFIQPVPYETHKLELNTGDSIYIFSDGFPDQFGGENLPASRQGGKKFKSSNFKKLLLSIQNETMEAQDKILDKTFEEWRGKLEQIDDVCIIGVRI